MRNFKFVAFIDEYDPANPIIYGIDHPNVVYDEEKKMWNLALDTTGRDWKEQNPIRYKYEEVEKIVKFDIGGSVLIDTDGDGIGDKAPTPEPVMIKIIKPDTDVVTITPEPETQADGTFTASYDAALEGIFTVKASVPQTAEHLAGEAQATFEVTPGLPPVVITLKVTPTSQPLT